MAHWAVNTVLLAATNTVTGTIGFFYRLILSKYLGSEGMGIYQQTLAFFSTAITIVTAGIPVSVSKLIAENQGENIKKKSYNHISFFTNNCLLAVWGPFSHLPLLHPQAEAAADSASCSYICWLLFCHERVFLRHSKNFTDSVGQLI